MAAAIAASNGVLVPVWGMTLSVASLRGEVLLKWTRIAFEGCALVLSDGDSDSIIGGLTISIWGWMQQSNSYLIVGMLSKKALSVTATT